MKAKIAIWPLALCCAVLPVIAVHTAWLISMVMEYVPACIPYIEGCTSISRSARQGLANHVFGMIMYPAAVLQIMVWFLCRAWLIEFNQSLSAAATLPYLGLTAGICLCCYITFLGTEGDMYRFMRRYGIALYFGLSYLAQLIVVFNLKPIEHYRIVKAMLVICLVLLIMGLSSLYFSATFDDPLKFRAENIAEWNMSLLMMLWFVCLAFIWRKLKLQLAFVSLRV